MMMCKKMCVTSERGEVAEWHDFADQTALQVNKAILDELEAACLKHPSFCLGNLFCGLVVTMEELGETAEALLEGDLDHVIHEMAQVGACAHRFVDEAMRMKVEGAPAGNDEQWRSLAESIKMVGTWARVRLDRVIKEAAK